MTEHQAEGGPREGLERVQERLGGQPDISCVGGAEVEVFGRG